MKKILKKFQREIKVYQLVLKDERTPRLAKRLLGFAIGYSISPIDLIPDFIPIIGHLDDLIIVPTLIWLAMRAVPKEVFEDCRQKADKHTEPP